MKEIKIVVVLHLILGPLGYSIMAEDARHPERWGTWYRNPSYAIPYCVALEAFIWGALLLKWRKEKKVEERIPRMQEAKRGPRDGNTAFMWSRRPPYQL